LVGNILGIIGRMGAGKTTASNYLQSTYGFTRIAFADALKEKAVRITPDGRIDKVRDRALLQFLGTEYFRGIDQEYWINAWRETVQQTLFNESRGVAPPGVVTDDCRFANECAIIHALGGKLIYLTVTDAARHKRLAARDGKQVEGIKGHASEDVSDLRFQCDDIVVNNGSEAQLYAELDRVYSQLLK
jgi:dephospho-CoA kinase